MRVRNENLPAGLYQVTLGDGQQCCASCGQPLPGGSKLSKHQISAAEAERHGWPAQQNPDGTVTVNMCLQCQIDRAKAGTAN